MLGYLAKMNDIICIDNILIAMLAIQKMKVDIHVHI